MRIPLNDMKRHYEGTREIITPAIERVVASGWYILGDECKAFEQQFAAYCGAHACVAVASGTDALEFALRAVGVAAGSRVATVANASFYTSTALFAINAIPVFVDVNPTTHLMDLECLDAALAGGAEAVVVTHLYGLLHDMSRLLEMTKRYGVPLIEDCAQAHGAVRNDGYAGSFGHASAFSFYPTKNLGGIGDGGAVLTRDAATADRVRLLRQYGWNPKYHVTLGGARNSRLDEIQAAVLLAKLPHLDRWNSRRRAIAARYSSQLNNPRVKVPPLRGREYVAHLYVIECEDRESLRAHLADAGITTDIHYPVPDHQQQLIANTGQWPPLPVSEFLSGRVLTLPCFPELSDDEVDFVVARINEWQ